MINKIIQLTFLKHYKEINSHFFNNIKKYAHIFIKKLTHIFKQYQEINSHFKQYQEINSQF